MISCLGLSFQFHIGAIISGRQQKQRYAGKLFQFHIGAIISRSGDRRTVHARRVSIPYWCNYKLQEEEIERAEKFCFNSILVQL